MIANWMGLLPGFGTIGFFHKPVHVAVETTTEATKEPAKEEKPSPVQNTHETVVTSDTKEITETAVTNEEKKEEEELEFIPILRASTADLNTTLALATLQNLSILKIRSTLFSDFLNLFPKYPASYHLHSGFSETFLQEKCSSQSWHFSCRLSYRYRFL
jgi:type III secretory pathway component EscV